MAKPDAATRRANPAATTKCPADDAGADEYLYPAPEHSRFLSLWPSRTAAANPSADGSAVDGAGPATAADVPAAGPTTTAVVPADGAGVDEHLHADVQHPALLPAGRDAPRSGGHPRKPKVRSTETNKEKPEEKLRKIILALEHEPLAGPVSVIVAETAQ